ncbi:hypothetical protein K8D10_00205 [Aeromonas veronii]|uniref:cobaltochelatase CobT-related protein n=1 Tax=Aeromonas veronii TaxID=654 RepID=UPI00207D6E58|nr:hypothetical protein [Aeromonas veronii]MCO4170223.1 hypothetical protein [Aeromonas veronii]
MNSTDLVIECNAIARVLGRSQVRVEFAGSEAWNDGSLIRLPEIAAGKVSDDKVAMMRGYTDHETAHSLFTDFEFFRQHDKTKADQINYLEDPRIEAAYQQQYPGAWSSLNAMRHVSAQLQLDALAKVPPHLLDWGRLIFGAVKWTASQMMGHGGDVQRTLTAMIPEQYRPLASEFATRSMAAKSTQEIAALVDELRERVKQEQAKEPQKAPEQEQEQEQEPSEGDDKDEGEDGEGDEGQEDGGDGEGQGEQQAPLIDEAAILSGMASREVGLPKFNLQLFEYKHDDAHVCGVAFSAKEKVAISPMGSHAKSILKRALIGVDDSRWLGGRVHGLLDANDLVRAYQGEDDVYRQRTKDPELDTAVTLLIDMSSSMRGERIEWATKTALMLGDALDSLGVPLSILGHTTMALNNYALYPKADVDQVFEFANEKRHPQLASFKFQNADQTGRKLKGGRTGKVVERLAIKAYERYQLGHSLNADEVYALGCALTSAQGYISSDPLVMFNLLGFGVRIRNARDVIERLPYLVGVYGANNIDNRAIEFAVNRIKVCKQKRKIILMLCDGIPYARGMLSKSLNNYTVAATIEAQKQDVTIIAIGFGESKVAEIFHNHVALASIGQMEDVVLSVVREVLRASQTSSKCTMVGGAGVRV